jgi:hypothetical protein
MNRSNQNGKNGEKGSIGQNTTPIYGVEAEKQAQIDIFDSEKSPVH